MVDEEAYPNVCPARNSKPQQPHCYHHYYYYDDLLGVAASGRTAYASASVRGRASGRGGEGRRG